MLVGDKSLVALELVVLLVVDPEVLHGGGVVVGVGPHHESGVGGEAHHGHVLPVLEPVISDVVPARVGVQVVVIHVAVVLPSSAYFYC